MENLRNKIEGFTSQHKEKIIALSAGAGIFIVGYIAGKKSVKILNHVEMTALKDGVVIEKILIQKSL